MKLFPPAFRSASAVLSEKIDELTNLIHAILDGGLDADNLAPGVVLPLGQFVENRSQFLVQATGQAGHHNLAVQLPVTARLLAVGVAATDRLPRRVIITAGAPEFNLVTFDVPEGETKFSQELANPVTVSADQPIWVQADLGDTSNVKVLWDLDQTVLLSSEARLTLLFDAEHQEP